MNNVFLKTSLVAVLLNGFSTSLIAADLCEKIGFESSKQYELKSKLNNYTHIILPERIKQGTKPIVGNSELWDVDGAGPHIYIKPNSTEDEGKLTSLSAVGESGVSYDFKVTRSTDIASTCIELTTGLIFSESQRQALRNNPGEAMGHELAELWKQKYREEQQKQSREIRTAVAEALRRYRYQIYTRYDWNRGRVRPVHGSTGFIGSNLISDVYDDGRFTYIRVRNSNKGIMMIEAELENQVEIIQAKFDPITKIYTISGIFPSFTMKYNDSKVEVQRADNYTVGAY